MIKKLCTFCFVFIQVSLIAQLTIKLSQIPSNTPAMSDIFIAGSFQGWEPDHSDYILTKNDVNELEININPPIGEIKFKFTRGDWVSVEGNENGGFRSDRVFNYKGMPTTLHLEILSWEDLDGGMNGNSTAADNVFIFDSDYFMPQLNRERKIWVYLPPDYHEANKYYPVLYMHDGQNLFDNSTSFSGEWEIDESLNQLFDDGDFGCIVVGIENGGAERINEFSPWNNPQYGGGQGDAYLQFIVNTLKPEIDANYRTLPGREYTGLMGSSLGGLITHYGIVAYQSTFSKVGIFSPSYWFSPLVFDHTAATEKAFPVRMYTIGGASEGGSMAQNIEEMEGVLLNSGYEMEALLYLIHADGRHSEWYWRREFPAAYQWLFGDLQLTPITDNIQPNISVFPNPADSLLLINGLNSQNGGYFELFDNKGHLVQRNQLKSNYLDTLDLQNGFYILKIYVNTQVVLTEKIVIQH